MTSVFLYHDTTNYDRRHSVPRTSGDQASMHFPQSQLLHVNVDSGGSKLLAALHTHTKPRSYQVKT